MRSDDEICVKRPRCIGILILRQLLEDFMDLAQSDAGAMIPGGRLRNMSATINVSKMQGIRTTYLGVF